MTDHDIWSATMKQLIGTLGGDASRAQTAAELRELLAETFGADISDDRLWLVWSTLRGEMPIEDDLIRFRRNIVLNGAANAISDLGSRRDASIFGLTAEIEIVDDPILVDVHNTANASYMSGIQRVVRETTGRWAAEHDLTFVAWADSGVALRRLTAKEESRMRGTSYEETEKQKALPARLIIPNGGLMIIPELSADSDRADRFLAMGRYASTRIAYIGYDCVPLTSGETAAGPMAAHFPLYLDAVAYADKVATISESTALEFDSWKLMLPASGRTGPDVRAVFLAGDSEEPTEASLAKTRKAIDLSPGEPLVLAVGSHEPRKNHLSVLQAARLLWEEGVKFRLVMIGSGSWNSGAFDNLAASLQDQGHPLVVLSGASDSLLAASYRLATVSVFTSFHEGFGLPIVESLRAGTPVIASNVGSMLELAQRYGGVITVDPHSDVELEQVLRQALSDPAVLAEKRSELAGNTYRTWDEYSSEVWEYFVGA